MHKLPDSSQSIARLAACSLLLATAMPDMVSASGKPDQWEYDATIYLWGAGIDATTNTGGDVDISFSDILDDLDMTFMGGVAARNGKWSLLLDAVYLDMSQSGGGSETIPVLGPLAISTTVETDIEMKAWITTFGGGYNVVETEKVTLDLVGGARYLWLDAEVKLDLSTAAGQLQTSREKQASDSKSFWDGIVGARGKINLNNNWYMPYYVDAGTGQSDLTWQVMAGIGYQFKWGDVQLAYRHLDYEFDSDFLLEDLTVSGPVLGARFKF